MHRSKNASYSISSSARASPGSGLLFVERQRRAETQASSASLSVLVMTADPKRAFAILVSTLGHKIKVLIIDVHHVDAAGIKADIAERRRHVRFVPKAEIGKD
jgi:hypothetical protein